MTSVPTHPARSTTSIAPPPVHAAGVGARIYRPRRSDSKAIRTKGLHDDRHSLVAAYSELAGRNGSACLPRNRLEFGCGQDVVHVGATGHVGGDGCHRRANRVDTARVAEGSDGHRRGSSRRTGSYAPCPSGQPGTIRPPEPPDHVRVRRAAVERWTGRGSPVIRRLPAPRRQPLRDLSRNVRPSHGSIAPDRRVLGGRDAADDAPVAAAGRCCHAGVARTMSVTARVRCAHPDGAGPRQGPRPAHRPPPARPRESADAAHHAAPPATPPRPAPHARCPRLSVEVRTPGPGRDAARGGHRPIRTHPGPKPPRRGSLADGPTRWRSRCGLWQGPRAPSCLFVLAASTPAFGHAELAPPAAAGRWRAGLTLLVAHGCGGEEERIWTAPMEEEATTSISSRLPLELAMRPAAGVTGWTCATATDPQRDGVTNATWRQR